MSASEICNRLEMRRFGRLTFFAWHIDERKLADCDEIELKIIAGDARQFFKARIFALFEERQI